MKREDSDFTSGGTRCAGWLYYPDADDNPPVVIMAHGFGGERQYRLPAFAERFTEHGLAVFIFDYRYFGASHGEPRRVISPSLQV
ncbi:MAG: alpha/beta hydrolase, partial [Halobacteria archaeon]|nr:alpha/beta hydrolase [Halobacteria archaeon]